MVNYNRNRIVIGPIVIKPVHTIFDYIGKQVSGRIGRAVRSVRSRLRRAADSAQRTNRIRTVDRMTSLRSVGTCYTVPYVTGSVLIKGKPSLYCNSAAYSSTLHTRLQPCNQS